MPVGASNAKDVPIEFPPESIFAPPELIVIRSMPFKKLLVPAVACTVPPLKFRYCVPAVLETPIEAVLVNPPFRFNTEPPDPEPFISIPLPATIFSAAPFSTLITVYLFAPPGNPRFINTPEELFTFTVPPNRFTDAFWFATLSERAGRKYAVVVNVPPVTSRIPLPPELEPIPNSFRETDPPERL